MTKADKAISYRHNALGQRVAKLVDGVVTEKYLWQDLTTLLAVYDANDNVKQRFEYGLSHTPVSFTQSGQRYYIQTDHLGSPRVISTATGTVIKTISYDSYGNVISDSNPDFSIPFGFAGGLYDADTGLIRFGYRDYDPETGRWTARDPIGFAGGDTNLYGYVLGDPVNFIDPIGLMSWNWGYFWSGVSQGVVDAQATPHYFDVSDGADPCSSEYRIGMAFGQAFARGSQGPYARSPALRMTAKTPRAGAAIDPKRSQHIFRDKAGHLQDTPGNRRLLESVADNSLLTLGKDKYGNTWSAQNRSDGTQVWTQSRDGKIINGGVNQTPKTFNPETGLSSPVKPGKR